MFTQVMQEQPLQQASPPIPTKQIPHTDRADDNQMDNTDKAHEDKNLQTMQDAANGGSHDDSIQDHMIQLAIDHTPTTQEHETRMAPNGQLESKR